MRRGQGLRRRAAKLPRMGGSANGAVTLESLIQLNLPPTTRDVVRNASRAVLSIQHWKARLVLWSAAVAVGVVAVAFARAADLAQLGLRKLVEIWPWWPWVLAPPGFFVIAWLTRRYFRGAEGSGIPQTIFTLKPDTGEAGAQLLKVHVVIGRMVLACVGLLCGGSIGREGPTVHVGAVIAQSFGRWKIGRAHV